MENVSYSKDINCHSVESGMQSNEIQKFASNSILLDFVFCSFVFQFRRMRWQAIMSINAYQIIMVQHFKCHRCFRPSMLV